MIDICAYLLTSYVYQLIYLTIKNAIVDNKAILLLKRKEKSTIIVIFIAEVPKRKNKDLGFNFLREAKATVMHLSQIKDS